MKASNEENERLLILYVEYWTSICTHCLGWPKEKTKQFIAGLTVGKHPVVLHEKPGYWIAEAFIPDESQKLSMEDQGRLYARIVDAIDPGNDFHASHSEAECDAIHDRVNAVLRSFGIEQG